MNAPVPEWDADPVSDIVPISREGAVQFFEPEFHNTHSTFIGFEHCVPATPSYVYLRVQDYAAAASLEVERSDEPCENAAVQIPYNYERFWSDADPDRDGFTNWEEYRGFVGLSAGIPVHGRTDSLRPDFFVDDQMGYIDWNAVQCASGYFPWTAHNWPVLIGDYRHWLDFMVARTGNLTEAGYDPPANLQGPETIGGLDQAVCRVTVNNSLPWPTIGRTPQHPGGDGNCAVPLFQGPSGTIGSLLTEPPCDGSVEICVTNIDWLVDEIWVRDYGLPAEGGLNAQVWYQRLTRAYMHELGHALGINHHCPTTSGSHGCVMKYENASDWYYGESWNQYAWGQGYMDDEWDCAWEKGLRP